MAQPAEALRTLLGLVEEDESTLRLPGRAGTRSSPRRCARI